MITDNLPIVQGVNAYLIEASINKIFFTDYQVTNITEIRIVTHPM